MALCLLLTYDFSRCFVRTLSTIMWIDIYVYMYMCFHILAFWPFIEFINRSTDQVQTCFHNLKHILYLKTTQIIYSIILNVSLYQLFNHMIAISATSPKTTMEPQKNWWLCRKGSFPQHGKHIPLKSSKENYFIAKYRTCMFFPFPKGCIFRLFIAVWFLRGLCVQLEVRPLRLHPDKQNGLGDQGDRTSNQGTKVGERCFFFSTKVTPIFKVANWRFMEIDSCWEGGHTQKITHPPVEVFVCEMCALELWKWHFQLLEGISLMSLTCFGIQTWQIRKKIVFRLEKTLEV